MEHASFEDCLKSIHVTGPRCYAPYTKSDRADLEHPRCGQRTELTCPKCYLVAVSFPKRTLAGVERKCRIRLAYIALASTAVTSAGEQIGLLTNQSVVPTKRSLCPACVPTKALSMLPSFGPRMLQLISSTSRKMKVQSIMVACVSF